MLIVPVFDILLLFNITCPTFIFLELTAFGSLDNTPFPIWTAVIFILFPADIFVALSVPTFWIILSFTTT